MSTLISKLKNAAQQKNRPDETPYLSLSLKEEIRLSRENGVSRKAIQISALKEGITPERYCRNQRYLGFEEQIKLLQSHVAVIGLGGLGGAVVEILARVGIGNLTLVDGDSFDESNLNRQLLSSEKMLGIMKARAAADRALDINGAISVFPVQEFFDEQNDTAILESAHIAVDCLDTIRTRFVLNASCRTKNIPMVSGAIGGAAGQATTILPAHQTLTTIYGNADKATKRGIEASLGTMVYAATSIAALQCTEVISLLTGKKNNLSEKLLLADYETPSIDIIDFA